MSDRSRLFGLLLLGAGLGQRLGLVPRQLDPDIYEAKARKATGLTDFGHPYYREGLERLCTSLNGEARLNAYGYALCDSLITGFLQNRLLLQDLRNSDSPILQTPLNDPIIVTGLARSGTTVLHRLLSAAPGHHGPQFWELISPMSRGPSDTPEKRFKHATGLLRPRRIFTPELDAVHFIREDTLEECIWLMGLTFASRGVSEVTPVYSYLRWYLDDAPREQKYRDYADLLRVLQHANPGKRLVMKTPEHMDALDALLAAVPNAKIVVTHRNPHSAIGSYLSLHSIVTSLDTDHFDKQAARDMWLELAQTSITRYEKTRQGHEAQIFDHNYDRFLADPVAEIERIFAFHHIDFTDKTRAALEHHRRENTQHKHGAHSYDLASFGLTAAEIDQRFKPYIAKYIEETPSDNQ